MFEKIVRGPEPWYFGHVFLPGGTPNLNKEEYGLGRGTKASIVGTLMRVRDIRTLEDGRQQIVVQALNRMVVVNETTGENPYVVGGLRRGKWPSSLVIVIAVIVIARHRRGVESDRHRSSSSCHRRGKS